MLRQGGIKGRFTRPSPPWNLRARGAAHSSARWSRGLTQVSRQVPAAPAADSPKKKKKARGSGVAPRRSPANYASGTAAFLLESSGRSSRPSRATAGGAFACRCCCRRDSARTCGRRAGGDACGWNCWSPAPYLGAPSSTTGRIRAPRSSRWRFPRLGSCRRRAPSPLRSTI